MSDEIKDEQFQGEKTFTRRDLLIGTAVTAGGILLADSFPTTAEAASASVSYRVHVQRIGWSQGWRSNGATAGTSGRSLRLEAIQIKLPGKPVSGSVQYRTHVQRQGWQGWRGEGQTSGTSGKSLRLEAIQIRLTGQMAERYDVWYRVHAQKFGWMGWAKNGASAGSAGYSYRLEAIQVKLVAKGSSAPGSTANTFRQNPDTNANAHKAYEKTLREVKGRALSSFDTVYYRYANVYGGSVDELICKYSDDYGYVGEKLCIYTFVNGKVKQMLLDCDHGASVFKFYKSTSSFMLHWTYHGYELDAYYQASGDVYKSVASRGRRSTSVGAETTSPWEYYVKDSKCTKTTFDAFINKLTKGAVIDLSGLQNWSKF